MIFRILCQKVKTVVLPVVETAVLSAEKWSAKNVKCCYVHFKELKKLKT